MHGRRAHLGLARASRIRTTQFTLLAVLAAPLAARAPRSMRPAAAPGARAAFALAALVALAAAPSALALNGQTTANFPSNGAWNFNGTGGGLNPRCLPLSDRLAELFRYDLAEPGAFYTALFQLVATGVTGTVETPIAFQAFGWIKAVS